MTLRRLPSREIGTVVLLALVALAAGLKEPRFFQPASVESVLLWIPLLAVLGVGQMLVIVTRGIDVSIGSAVGVAAMGVGMFFRSHPDAPVPVGVALGIGIGLTLGCLNAGLIAGAKLPPIIVTLGTLSVYRGLVFIMSGGVQVDSQSIPVALTRWSEAGPISVGGVVIPWILWIAVVVLAGGVYFVKQTRAGRNVFAFGSNPEAARLRGVPVGRTQFLVYAISGSAAGLAGVLYASRFGVVNPATAGQGLELVVIAAVVIGGTQVTGGSGTVFGVLLGAMLLGTINVALAVVGISETWQQLVYGVVILVAVLADSSFRSAIAKRVAEAK